MKLEFATEWAVLLAGTMLLTGCATPALWARKRYEPIQQPHLSLWMAHDGKDLLVCYDEHCEKDSKAHRRAYWLFNYNASGKSTKPHFVNPGQYEALCSVAVSEFAPKEESGPGYYAVTDSSRGSSISTKLACWLVRTNSQPIAEPHQRPYGGSA